MFLLANSFVVFLNCDKLPAFISFIRDSMLMISLVDESIIAELLADLSNPNLLK